MLAGTPSGWPEFVQTLKDRRDEVEAVMLERRTQTNEAGRCALMLPLLAALPQPLALLEVGASAGLCLLPDRYAYDYDQVREIGATWLACEGPDILGFENDRRRHTRKPSGAFPVGTDVMALTRDGERVAYADGHGGYLSWG